MKLALIAPLSLLTFKPNTNYHLMLPQLASGWWYKSLYKFRGQDPEQYVILDNGAAEGCMVPSQVLTDVADKFKVDEVVMPDKLGDTLGTSILVHNFLRDLQGVEHPYKLGLVVTGRNSAEAFDFGLQMVDQWTDKVDVLYLPRLLVTEEDLYARLDLAEDFHEIYPDLEIHFLVANSLFIREMELAGRLDFIRGMDTSAPYNYTFAGKSLDSDEQVNRPEGYFGLNVEEFDFGLLQYNIDLALKWTNGE